MANNILVAFAALVLAAPVFYFVFVFADQLNAFDRVTAIVLPILWGFAFFMISNRLMDRALHREREHFDKAIGSLAESLRPQGIKAYATKKSVPGGSKFWNRLPEQAYKRLFIVGTTNKSWFDKSEDQSRRLAYHFARIKKNGGQVVVVSLDRESNIAMMKRYFEKFMSTTRDEDDAVSYRTVKSLNYGAILTDDKIALMPLLHGDNFREETMVLEIPSEEFSNIFDNYKADIERTVEGADRKLE